MNREQKLAEALRNIRACLHHENERGPAGPICDTIWYSRTETLFDYIDNTLEAITPESGQEPAPLASGGAGGNGGVPVAWRVHPFDYGIGHEGVFAMTMRADQVSAWERKGWRVEPLYTTPQPVALVPLTPQALRELIDDAGLDWHRGWTVADEGGESVNRYLNLARAIERAHGIGATLAGGEG